MWRSETRSKFSAHLVLGEWFANYKVNSIAIELLPANGKSGIERSDRAFTGICVVSKPVFYKAS